ncbi:GNAT family N-acetyltransferase [Erwinia sp. AnSW2-5]|uniref:GNAT family N-acetyltransferase n=1 Tax=Erwinia sp. AnSW2-5 TaxID=3367692 RepID=UPI00385E5B65
MYKDRKHQQLSIPLNKIVNPDEKIKIKFATTSEEFIEAMQLIHCAYAKKGLITSDKRQPYFSPHLVLPNNRLIIATRSDCIIGTISLIEDSPIGVPMDNIHAAETAALRKQCTKFAEIGSFAITPEFQHHGINLILYKAIFIYVCKHRNIESILIAVHPRVAEIYKVLFKFEQIGAIQEYSTLNNAKSMPLRINTHDAIAAINKNNIFRQHRSDECIEYLLDRNDEIERQHYKNNHKGDLKYIPMWQEHHIKKYFDECSIKIKNLPEKQRVIISWLYPALN